MRRGRRFKLCLLVHPGYVLICPSCQSAATGGIDLAPKSNPYLRYPVPLKRGVGAIVTDVGCGMRWTRAVSATNDVDPRTAKSCGPDAPTLVSSVRKVFRRRRGQTS